MTGEWVGWALLCALVFAQILQARKLRDQAERDRDLLHFACRRIAEAEAKAGTQPRPWLKPDGTPHG